MVNTREGGKYRTAESFGSEVESILPSATAGGQNIILSAGITENQSITRIVALKHRSESETGAAMAEPQRINPSTMQGLYRKKNN